MPYIFLHIQTNDKDHHFITNNLFIRKYFSLPLLQVPNNKNLIDELQTSNTIFSAWGLPNMSCKTTYMAFKRQR